MVECDVRRSVDGALALAHDESVTDRSGRVWTIAETDRASLAGLDLGAGEGVPTLEELVARVAGRNAVMADMKVFGDGIEAQVAAALAPLGRDAKLVPGAPADSRARFRLADPPLPISLSMDEALTDDAFEALLPTIDTDAVTWRYPMLTPARIAALQARGLRVFAWTVDDEPTMRRLIDAGIDGIITNVPDRLRALR